MNIYERMVRFEIVNHLPENRREELVVRCWIPVESPAEELNDKEVATSCLQYFSGFGIKGCDNYLKMAELLCLAKSFNACEVTNKVTGAGGVFYREWP